MDPFEIPTTDTLLARAMRMPRVGKKKLAHPALPPEEERSLLGEVLNKGVGGLQYLGETLDKPGRIVRGLATGNVREVGNLIPFSDTLGITDPSKSTSGKDLLQHYGLQQKGAEGFGAGAAGFGTEVLTDPLTYLTFGASAVGKAGKVAKAVGASLKGSNRFKTLGEIIPHLTPELKATAEAAAGKLGTTLEALKGEKLGGAFGLTSGPFGLLGMHATHVPEIAKGPAAQAAIEGLGKIGETVGKFPGIKQTKTILRGAFGHEYQGQFNPMAQEMAKVGTQKFGEYHRAAVHQFYALNEQMENLVKDIHGQYGSQIAPGLSGADALKAARDAVQRAVIHAGETKGAGHFQDIIPSLKLAPNHQEAISKIGIGLAEAQNILADAARKRGIPLGELQGTDRFGHLFRQGEKRVTATPMRARGKAIAYVPQAHIESLLQDASLMLGANNEPASVAKIAVALKTPGGHFERVLKDAANASGMPVDKVRKQLARYLADQGVGFISGQHKFNADVLGNNFRYAEVLGRKVSNGDAIHDLFKANISTDPTNSIGLAKAFQDAGLQSRSAVEHFAEIHGLDPKAAKSLRIHKDAVEGAVALLKKGGSSPWMKKVGELVDAFNSRFKQNVTLPFPGFSVRNRASGIAFNAMGGEIHSIQDAWAYLKHDVEAESILKNPADHKKILNEILGYEVHDVRRPQSMGTDLAVGPAANKLGWNLADLPQPASGVKAMAQKAWEDSKAIGFNPDVLGAKLPKPAKWGRAGMAFPAQMGAEVNKHIEFKNRVAEYLYLRKHLGWSPEAAAQRVKNLQIDYEALAPFERDFMKRIVPFYTYARRSVPEMLKQISERPGGLTAQIVRASNIGRSENEFVPPYVGEGMSVKLGDNKYLSQIGLPTDQFSDLFTRGPTALGTVKRTGQKLLSMTNPLVKGPLETATGQNFFTGRPIEESFAYPTRSVLANQMLHNTPASRAMTTTRQLMDERKDLLTKGLNLATGLRITQPSGGVERQQRLAESKMLSEMLRESPDIAASTDVYPRRDTKTGKPLTLDPETEKLYRAYQHLKKIQADEAKKKKKRPGTTLAPAL